MKLRNGLTVERVLLGQKIKQSNSSGPHIDSLTTQLALRLHPEHLRCHEPNRPEGSFDLITVVLEELTHSEIAKVELPKVVEHNVSRFDVSMREVYDLMAIVDCRDQLAEESSDCLLIKSTLRLFQL